MKRVYSRVLTLRQPWADLVMAGVKDVENRTWPVPSTLPHWTRCPVCEVRIDTIRCEEHDGPSALYVDDGPFPFRLWIHAAKTVDFSLDKIENWIALGDAWGLGRDRTANDALARAGNLLGYVTPTGCHHAHDCRERVPIYSRLGGAPEEGEAYCSSWSEPDVWHWTLEDPVPLEQPIPLKGRQGLWRLPEGVA